MISIAIIGAGLSGLVLANQFKDRARVTVLEKSRGVGGRMSTRYQDAYSFDHGAQYFTAKSAEFREFLKPQLETGLVQEWHPRFVTIQQGTRPQVLAESSGFYVAVPRMTSLCKELSSEIDVQLEQEIAAIERANGAWQLRTIDGGIAGTFDWVVSTAPAFQAHRILPINFLHRGKLEATLMAGCFTLMLGYEQRSAIAWDAAKVAGSPIGWIAVNSSKAGRPTGHSIVVQTTNDWAEAHLDVPKEKIAIMLLEALADVTGRDFSGAAYMSLHRWRYAGTSSPAGAPYLIDVANRLAACGDWCIKGRVEAAFTSARELADALSLEIR